MSQAALKDKVVLVTGASRGIGHGIALALGREGATVIGTATTAEGAERLTQALKKEGVNGVGMQLDVTQQESVDAVLAAIKTQFGPVSILVNNAAITQDNI